MDRCAAQTTAGRSEARLSCHTTSSVHEPRAAGVHEPDDLRDRGVVGGRESSRGQSTSLHRPSLQKSRSAVQPHRQVGRGGGGLDDAVARHYNPPATAEVRLLFLEVFFMGH